MLSKYCAQQNYRYPLRFDVIKVYEEEESIWKAGHQRQLAQLKADAAQHRFDVVLIWALDRLSREGALVILSLVNTLKADGVRIISYQEARTEAPGELAEVFALNSRMGGQNGKPARKRENQGRIGQSQDS